MSKNLCVCEALPALCPRTKIVIMTHRVELTKTTNTGRLVTRMLGEQAELVLSHDEDWQPAAADSFVLFPSEDALPLSKLDSDIGCLIVPDGTWTQTRRMVRRHPACQRLPKVRLDATPQSAYSLRRTHLNGGVCTLEAVAHALRVLEGASCAGPILDAFATWTKRALMIRAGAHDMHGLHTKADHV